MRTHDNGPGVIAHRGASGIYAENTRAAFLHAAAQGADLIETDVHLTADGVVVCIHSDLVEQPGTGGPVSLSTLTLEQLRGHDVHTWMGAQIPVEYGTDADQFMTLPELLESFTELGRDTGLLIELKEPYPFGRLLEQRVMEELTRFGWQPGDASLEGRDESAVVLYFISFDPDSLRCLRQAGVPAEQLMAVISERRQDAAELIDEAEVGVVAPKWDWIRQSPEHAEQVRGWRQAGVGVNIWTLNTEEGIQEALALGADWVTTDHPEMALSALGRASESSEPAPA